MFRMARLPKMHLHQPLLWPRSPLRLQSQKSLLLLPQLLLPRHRQSLQLSIQRRLHRSCRLSEEARLRRTSSDDESEKTDDNDALFQKGFTLALNVERRGVISQRQNEGSKRQSSE
jgi:hypothetical protein